MWGIFVSFLMAFSFQSEALTDYSRHVDWLQTTFKNANPQQTIVYLDRDRLHQGLAGVSDEEKQVQLVQRFVKERVGVDVDAVNADTMLDYLIVGNNVALPIELESGEKICAIVPSNPNLNSYQESKRLLHWQYVGSKPEFQGMTVVDTLSKYELMLTADLHETFHCLDNVHMAEREAFGSDGGEFHKAEAFAEAGALLYMAKLGFKDIAESRALFRLVGSFMQTRYKEEFGPRLDQNPIAWGAVYSFHDVIYAVGDFVNRDSYRADLALGEIESMAYNFVSEYGLSDTAFYAVRMHQEFPEKLRELIAEFKQDSHPHLRERYVQVEKDVDKYIQQLDAAFLSLLVKSAEPTEPPPQARSGELAEQPCPSVEDLDHWLDQTRQTHYQAGRDYLSEIATSLNNIYQCY